jgi:hypothetical protein
MSSLDMLKKNAGKDAQIKKVDPNAEKDELNKLI